ncbi:hypothetical protein DMH04_56570 [Kibdelosporangium aridum]|uniref:Uncharacterized protein n=1 Tax=Kibdelosporangium aridum TaxID=2030 RepID=A0A428XR64_KIBAR|nr:hypothetical protein DMH04_56570 [Kibdelosporangium aridum]
MDDRAPSPIVRAALQDWTPEGVHLLVIERLSAQWDAVPGQDGTTMWADVLVVLPRQVANPRNI